MPEIKINANTVGFTAAILAVIGSVATGITWINGHVATKDDVVTLETTLKAKVVGVEESLSRQSKLQYIDVMIQLSETAMMNFEARDELTPAEQRKYDQLKSVHTAQLEAYRKITNEI